MVEDHKVEFERCHEHEDGNNDETKNTGAPMFRLILLYARELNLDFIQMEIRSLPLTS